LADTRCRRGPVVARTNQAASRLRAPGSSSIARGVSAPRPSRSDRSAGVDSLGARAEVMFGQKRSDSHRDRGGRSTTLETDQPAHRRGHLSRPCKSSQQMRAGEVAHNSVIVDGRRRSRIALPQQMGGFLRQHHQRSVCFGALTLARHAYPRAARSVPARPVHRLHRSARRPHPGAFLHSVRHRARQ
jgi:hypothetical protein